DHPDPDRGQGQVAQRRGRHRGVGRRPRRADDGRRRIRRGHRGRDHVQEPAGDLRIPDLRAEGFALPL
ncbi:MAG: hypothetical protein AVDCRST_MAG73-4109, partial [uncultured Thermomicrobiales bacterium]